LKQFQILIAAAAFALTAGAAAMADPAPATSGDQASAPPTPAAAGTTGTDAPKAKPAHDPNQMICRTILPTGSRLGGQKVCQTRHDWDEQAKAGRDTVDHVTSRANQFSPNGN
jgi:hypothetical protein